MIDCLINSTYSDDSKFLNNHRFQIQSHHPKKFRENLWSCYSMTDLTLAYTLQTNLQLLDQTLLSHSDSDLHAINNNKNTSRSNFLLSLQFTFDNASSNKENIEQSKCEDEILEENFNVIESRIEQSAVDVVVKSSTKKRVRFADEEGMLLTEVQTFESLKSNRYSSLLCCSVIPQPTVRLTSHQLNCVKPESSTIPNNPSPSWKPNCIIPAAQYIKFREAVDQNYVCLERLHIMEKSQSLYLSGSVKVKNIHYEKRVFVRVTRDDWATYTDHYAIYQPSGEYRPRYDIFVFKVPIDRPKTSHDCLQFAICFTCGASVSNEEYWDNNDNTNYIMRSDIESKSPLLESNKMSTGSHLSPRDSRPQQYNNLCSFTEFKAWEYFPSENVYY